MIRVLCWILLGWLLLCAGPGQTMPVEGPFLERSHDRKRKVLEPNSKVRFPCKFAGNERACVIVMGDHDPVMVLVLKVLDRHGKVVAEDGGGDVLAVTWYPPRTEDYYIEISQDPFDKTPFKDGYNALYVAVK